MKPSIIRLRALEKQLYAYLYAMTVIDFDAETVAPEGSADGRAEATEVLSRASFDLLVNDGTAALLKEAAADAETEQERAEVRKDDDTNRELVKKSGTTVIQLTPEQRAEFRKAAQPVYD